MSIGIFYLFFGACLLLQNPVAPRWWDQAPVRNRNPEVLEVPSSVDQIVDQIGLTRFAFQNRVLLSAALMFTLERKTPAPSPSWNAAIGRVQRRVWHVGDVRLFHLGVHPWAACRSCKNGSIKHAEIPGWVIIVFYNGKATVWGIYIIYIYIYRFSSKEGFLGEYKNWLTGSGARRRSNDSYGEDVDDSLVGNWCFLQWDEDPWDFWRLSRNVNHGFHKPLGRLDWYSHYLEVIPKHKLINHGWSTCSLFQYPVP